MNRHYCKLRNVAKSFALLLRSSGIPKGQITAPLLFVLCVLIFCAISGCSNTTASKRGTAGAENAPIATNRFESGTVRIVSLDDVESAARSLAVASPEAAEISGQLAAELLYRLRNMTLPGTRTVSIPVNPDWTKVTDLSFSRAARVLAWSYRNSGDYNLSGEVGVPDITPIALNYLKNATSEPRLAGIDGDGSGIIDSSDIEPIALNYLNRVEGYKIFGADTQSGQFIEIGELAYPIGPNAFPVRFEFSVPEDAPRFLSVIPFDSDGLHDTTGMTVDSHNTLPVAALSANPLSGPVPLEVSFDASASYDPDGEIVRYEWDFDGDGEPDLDTGDIPYAEYSYETKGLFQASVIVFDDLGGFATASVTVTAESAGTPPVALLNVSPLAGDAPLTVTFDASGSFDPDGEIVQYEWYWGGSTETDTRFDGWWYPVRTFGYPGEYEVVLKVTDDEGLTDTAEAIVTVTGDNPLYETENNDTPETANPLPPFPIEAGTVTGSIGSDEDFVGYDGDEEDWFSFEVMEQGYFNAKFIFNKYAEYGYGSILFNDLLQPIQYSIEGYSPFSSNLYAILPEPGKYYLRIGAIDEWDTIHIEYDFTAYFTPSTHKWEYFTYEVGDYNNWQYNYVDGIAALTYNNVLHFSYALLDYTDEGDQSDIYYGKFADDSWEFYEVDTSAGWGSRTGIAMTSSGLPAIAYMRYDKTTSKSIMRLAKSNGSNWIYHDVEIPTPLFYANISLMINQDDYAHVVFINPNDGYLYHVRETSEGLEIIQLDYIANTSIPVQADIDSKGTIHMVFNESNNSQVCYGILKGEQLEVNILPLRHGRYDIKVDSDDYAHIAVRARITNENARLYYAFYDQEWIIEKISDHDATPILSIDESGNPSIAYLIPSGGGYSSILYFADKWGEDWNNEIVDVSAYSPDIVCQSSKMWIFYPYEAGSKRILKMARSSAQ